MSLYNMMHGHNPAASLVLFLVGKSQYEFGRYRDAFFTEGMLAVHTRCGGGNREDYKEVFDEMMEHPLYIRDEDGDFDSTYATFYFRMPEDAVERMMVEFKKNPETAHVTEEMARKLLTMFDQGKYDQKVQFDAALEAMKGGG